MHRILLAAALVAASVASALPLDTAFATVPGDESMLVIPLQFQDVKGTDSPLEIQNVFFADGEGERSVRDYFDEVSGGRYMLGGAVLPRWVTSAHDMAEYGNGESFGREPALDPVYPDTIPVCHMAYEAMQLADPFVDFASFLGEDGRLTVTIVHAGMPDDYSGLGPDVWSQAWWGGPLCDENGNWISPSFDGVQLYSFMTVSEFSPMGTSAHELGHALLRLPDLYWAPNNVGRWDLMASGSWGGYATAKPTDPQTAVEQGADPSHLSAYFKIGLGWMDVVRFGPTTTYAVTSALDQGKAVRLDVDVNACWTETMTNGVISNGPGGGRYFLLEKRDPAGLRYDGDHNTVGLLAWFVDECANYGSFHGMNQDWGLGEQRLRVVPSTRSGIAWAAVAPDEGVSLSPTSDMSSTFNGRSTGWVADFVSGSSYALRVGHVDMDATFQNPRSGWGVAAGGTGAGDSAAYVAQAETRTAPHGTVVWSRETPAKIAIQGAGPWTVGFVLDGVEHAMACTNAAGVLTCALPAGVPTGVHDASLVVHHATRGGPARTLGYHARFAIV